MNIDMRESDGVCTVTLKGLLNDQTSLEPTVNARLDGGTRMIIDLAGVDMVTSAGLSVLIRIVASANTQGARVVLAQPTPFVTGVLRTTRLDRFFDVLPDLEAARAALRSA